MALSTIFGRMRTAVQSRRLTAGSYRFQRVGFTVVVLGFSASLAAAEPAKRVFNIEAKPATQSLIDYARQAHTQLGYDVNIVDTILTNAVVGEYDSVEALELLLEGTGLKAEYGERGIFIRRSAEHEADSGSESAPATSATYKATIARVVTLPAAQASSPATSTKPKEEEPSEEEEDKRPRDEIVVTGTNIRGAAPVGAPLITLDREAIDRTGLSTIAEVIHALPQNSAAGPNETTTSILGTDGAENNASFGSSINLRGLGADKTLILVNGRRLPSAGLDGGFADISNIPLTAVERVEILTDGASALYGSDAVGGVVNIALYEDYDGAETRLEFGSVTDGDHRQSRFGQTFGKSWGSGSVFTAYEYFRQTKLPAADRNFAASSDLRPLGGDNFNLVGTGNPGTLVAGGQTFAIPEGQDGTMLTPSNLVAGTNNSQNRREGTSLLPFQERHSIFAITKQELTDNIEIFAEGRYSHRDFESDLLPAGRTLAVPASNPFFVDPLGGLSSVQVQYSFIDDFGPQQSSGEVNSYGVSAGVNTDLWTDWRLEVFGAYSRGESSIVEPNQPNTVALAAALADPNPDTAFNPFGDGSNTNPMTVESIEGFLSSNLDTSVWSVNGKVDGTIFSVPGGDVKLATGLEYREESFSFDGLDFRNTAEPVARDENDLGRHIVAAFGEIIIPLVGSGNRRPGIESLAVSAAVRFENYSDFGTTTNPKIGAEWSPVDWLTFRGTYGTSFRAPLLTELDPHQFSIFAFPFPDPASSTGLSNVMFLFGDNPGLQPEESTNWTIGLDIAPDLIAGLIAKVTYFDTKLDGRISSVDAFTVLQRESEFAEAITRNPDPAAAQALLDDPAFVDFGIPLTGADIDVIVDGRLSNISSTNLRGIDLGLTYTRDVSDLGSLSLVFHGSYVFDFEEAFTATAPIAESLDTFGRQVDFRARGTVSWSYDTFASSLFVNYVDGYTDDVSVPNRKIGSWTTVDLTIGYNIGHRVSSSWLRDVNFSISAINLFDQDPPFVNNPNGAGFDPVNARPRGRFISFQVGKAWP